MKNLTPRQAQILQMIRTFAAEHGYPPTRVKIADALGFRSVNAAVDHLKALARKGVIDDRVDLRRFVGAQVYRVA